jgi:FtsH-binding integral membrane protein
MTPLEGIMAETQKRRGGWSWWYLLFIVQLALVIWPPFYNKAEPAFFAIPFFYWYQLVAVLISAVLTAIVYFGTDD